MKPVKSKEADTIQNDGKKLHGSMYKICLDLCVWWCVTLSIYRPPTSYTDIIYDSVVAMFLHVFFSAIRILS